MICVDSHWSWFFNQSFCKKRLYWWKDDVTNKKEFLHFHSLWNKFTMYLVGSLTDFLSEERHECQVRVGSPSDHKCTRGHCTHCRHFTGSKLRHHNSLGCILPNVQFLICKFVWSLTKYNVTLLRNVVINSSNKNLQSWISQSKNKTANAAHSITSTLEDCCSSR